MKKPQTAECPTCNASVRHKSQLDKKGRCPLCRMTRLALTMHYQPQAPADIKAQHAAMARICDELRKATGPA